MRIPEVRERLRELAEDLDRLAGDLEAISSETRRLIGEMVRRREHPPAPVKSNPVTPELACGVRQCYAQDPDQTLLEIGVKFGVNQGRVSEILHGKRT